MSNRRKVTEQSPYEWLATTWDVCEDTAHQIVCKMGIYTQGVVNDITVAGKIIHDEGTPGSSSNGYWCATSAAGIIWGLVAGVFKRYVWTREIDHELKARGYRAGRSRVRPAKVFKEPPSLDPVGKPRPTIREYAQGYMIRSRTR